MTRRHALAAALAAALTALAGWTAGHATAGQVPLTCTAFHVNHQDKFIGIRCHSRHHHIKLECNVYAGHPARAECREIIS